MSGASTSCITSFADETKTPIDQTMQCLVARPICAACAAMHAAV